jgi:MoaA/NifB/PqqE/SkfB family radical SAM enzyme
MGPGNIKIIKVDGKYYHHLYAPGFPSKIFDEYIKGEFNRISPVNKKANLLTFIFFAITRKCPLQCEHCFEWDNLNKKESLELHHLKAVLKKFQEDGLSQFHLSGGEPLVRMKDLEELIASADKDSEFYVLTSGFNFTAANAKALKNAGLTGVVISLDHFDKEKHNAFRGFNDSYAQAIHAIQHSQQQNLVVALSICVTRTFITWNNLMLYADLAKKLKVVFIQLLEPKAVGHYKDKDVFLNKSHLELLERFYEMMNFDDNYKDYPIIIYHGYHQRRVGCMSGGNRALYIDSEGWINACPFCHTKNFNIKEVLENKNEFKALVRSAICPS